MFLFSKYHGCGNHFVITREEQVAGRDYSHLAKQICNPYIGVGADGFIVVRESPLEMLFYNMDGSMAPMCGNGIRCFSHYCADEGICSESVFPVKTGAGEMKIQVANTDPFTVKVNMGKPDFSPGASGINFDGPFIDQKVEGQCVSSFFMGTIHTVLWTENYEGWETLGETISKHPIYTEQTNVNFAKIVGEDQVQMKTYERGVGVTLACGTGACAVAVLGWLQGRFQGDVTVILPYGQLRISKGEKEEIYMEGPSTKVCTGRYYEEGEK